MLSRTKNILLLASLFLTITNSSCKKEASSAEPTLNPVIQQAFKGKINLNRLENYGKQEIPEYVTSRRKPISDEMATLGRVLFYDKNLSSDNTISCSSCHIQSFAFGDTANFSTGVHGKTGRHSMRLIDGGFAEGSFFWDKRASSLEEQVLMPIQDPIEMGYSGKNGQPNLSDLIAKIERIPYYPILFKKAFGNPDVTEDKMGQAMANFVRSIYSFDSKYDVGRSKVKDALTDFPNFTADENAGKKLFMSPSSISPTGQRIAGGAGCNTCHEGEVFSIDPFSRNNGITTSKSGVADLNVKRAPSLRDLFNPTGQTNGNFMHSANFSTIDQVLDHYNEVTPYNTELDFRLNNKRLNLTVLEKKQLEAFLKTLTGKNVYSNPKWSDPFQ